MKIFFSETPVLRAKEAVEKTRKIGQTTIIPDAAETASGCISISNIKGYFMYIQIKPSFVGTYIEILSSLKIFGGFYHEWYVGLTSDSKHSFLEVHNLNLLETDWILSNKTDLPVLNFLKKIFVQMGCRNDSSLDMSYSDQIYLFRL